MSEHDRAREIALEPFNVSVTGDWDDPNKAIPLIIRRAKDGETPNIWACPNGGIVKPTATAAEEARRILRPTQDEKDGDRAFYRAQSFLRNAAKAIDINDHDGPIFDDDQFHFEVSDLLTHISEGLTDEEAEAESPESRMPSYVHAAEEVDFTWNPIDALEDWLHDNMHEDAADELKDIAVLKWFWKAWMANQTIKSWNATGTMLVLDFAGFQRDIAAAQAIVDRGRPGDPHNLAEGGSDAQT